MLGRKQRDEVHARRAAQNIDGGVEARVDSGGIGEQPDAFAAQLGETRLGEDFVAEFHLCQRARKDAVQQEKRDDEPEHGER